ncbi:hypothetical protein CAPTEDRAFT_206398 [Capitella teleta]|uniref:Uncharacterized protein n=1 Tax=Capitella teleta TaxID=283909 RepID=R7TG50_CAPTE|nr:hypothetical protein CAPTEDRAFT_206398 [Capitella teleta]|eukprot:ELT90026.1 hypothetical protein CAPTEDRAFT_206398 [Capitella teleta]
MFPYPERSHLRRKRSSGDACRYPCRVYEYCDFVSTICRPCEDLCHPAYGTMEDCHDLCSAFMHPTQESRTTTSNDDLISVAARNMSATLKHKKHDIVQQMFVPIVVIGGCFLAIILVLGAVFGVRYGLNRRRMVTGTQSIDAGGGDIELEAI